MTYVVSFHRDWSGYSQVNMGNCFGMSSVTTVDPDILNKSEGDIVLSIRDQLAKDLKTSPDKITILNYWRR